MSARPKYFSDPLLLELVAKVDALTEQVVLLRTELSTVKPTRVSLSNAELVRCISRFANGSRFSTWELLDHCTLSVSTELRDAMSAALGEKHASNGKKLGRLLKRLEGHDQDGLRLVRDGDEGGTARWRVSLV